VVTSDVEKRPRSILLAWFLNLASYLRTSCRSLPSRFQDGGDDYTSIAPPLRAARG